MGDKQLIERLKQHEDMNHAVDWNVLEGIIDRDPEPDYQEGGVYYGQKKGGLIDGYGLMYCIDEFKDSNLFEGNWKLGTPIKGQCTYIMDNQWHKYDGTVDAKYLFTGYANWCCEQGDKYVGSFEKGGSHGYGEYTYEDGDKYEGQWRHDEKHGLGQCILGDGSYEVGEYKKDQKFGEHTYYSKEGKIIEIRSYLQGKEGNYYNVI
ncbi:hypothetical protein FGO68_gene8933 [Halteria grandinella]|uniref:MORN repeat protein n=1 Tax=Halteria grandinella TaxID=5974 RepID=A0A8J8NU01_HALGN|nr:hypothetical protein FGO68_gene8933 [Halteria grandinella]